MTWCENNGVDCIFGLAGNVVLDRPVEPAADDIRVRRAVNQDRVLRSRNTLRPDSPFSRPTSQSPAGRPRCGSPPSSASSLLVRAYCLGSQRSEKSLTSTPIGVHRENKHGLPVLHGRVRARSWDGACRRHLGRPVTDHRFGQVPGHSGGMGQKRGLPVGAGAESSADA